MKSKTGTPQFSLPKREYSKGPRKMVSQRWPENLLVELDRVAEAWGWSTTEVTVTALDQFLQWAKATKG